MYTPEDACPRAPPANRTIYTYVYRAPPCLKHMYAAPQARPLLARLLPSSSAAAPLVELDGGGAAAAQAHQPVDVQPALRHHDQDDCRRLQLCRPQGGARVGVDVLRGAVQVGEQRRQRTRSPRCPPPSSSPSNLKSQISKLKAQISKLKFEILSRQAAILTLQTLALAIARLRRRASSPPKLVMLGIPLKTTDAKKVDWTGGLDKYVSRVRAAVQIHVATNWHQGTPVHPALCSRLLMLHLRPAGLLEGAGLRAREAVCCGGRSAPTVLGCDGSA